MWRCTLAAGGIVLFALIGVTWVSSRPSIRFASMNEAKATITELGFLTALDHDEEDGIGSGFLITDQPVSLREVRLLCKSGPMGPQWQGKIWVTMNTPDWTLAAIPDGASVRTWGDVLAFGDDDLLRQIDSALFVSSLTR